MLAKPTLPTAGPLARGLACALVLMLAGCTAITGPSSTQVRVVSIRTAASLEPAFPSGVYRAIDANTADLFLTDLPLARVADPSDRLDDLSGSILHVHMFLVPSAGKTPIDPTACNVSIRHLVLARGAVGVYGGGGFMMPSGRSGDRTLSGSLMDASLRLVRSTPDFADLLGPSIASGSVVTTLDDRAAAAMAARFDRLSHAATPVAEQAAK